MKLIVGLGNPGAKYGKNRHNLGFMVVDLFVKNFGLSWRYSPDWIAFYAKDKNVYLKPSTFMNKSGVSIAALANFYNIDSKDILIIYDEVDLPLGKIRLAFNGLSAGHHGIDSIIECLGGVEFARLRVGIGRPEKSEKGYTKEVSDYVLEDFNKEEEKRLPGLIKNCEEAINSYISDGIEATMNKFN
ncbi:MAG: aminoacyl-tRNA hydrolase [Patescibacteria group bacterium]